MILKACVADGWIYGNFEGGKMMRVRYPRAGIAGDAIDLPGPLPIAPLMDFSVQNGGLFYTDSNVVPRTLNHDDLKTRLVTVLIPVRTPRRIQMGLQLSAGDKDAHLSTSS